MDPDLEKSPWDLSTAISLFKCISSYPVTRNTPEDTSNTNAETALIKLPQQLALDTVQRCPVPPPLSERAQSAQSQLIRTGPQSQTPMPSERAKRAYRNLLSTAHNKPVFWQHSQVRSANLIEKIVLDFDIQPRLAIPKNLIYGDVPSGLHVFVDFSNISIAFSQNIRQALRQQGIKRVTTPHISFSNFVMLLERQRPTDKRVLVGSTKSSPSLTEAYKLGYEISVLKRIPRDDGKNKQPKTTPGKVVSQRAEKKALKEHCVDEILILKILESIVDCKPSTIVLATGDGNVTDYSDGFIKAVERCLFCGWEVELLAFKQSLNRAWQKIESPKFRIILLDPYLLNLI
ncbi:hypothetical protein ABW19_dt0202463 [Dactylella cylindrospora]|nr:hypothetical protein ABW19_dt0202463 [Dactylella cylindrospora]